VLSKSDNFTCYRQIGIEPATSSVVISASLYNFNVDDDQPKPEHLRWLDENIVPLLLGTTY